MYSKFDNLVKSSTTLEIISLMVDDEVLKKHISKYLNISAKSLYNNRYKLISLCNATIERLLSDEDKFNNRYNRMKEVVNDYI